MLIKTQKQSLKTNAVLQSKVHLPKEFIHVPEEFDLIKPHNQAMKIDGD